MKHKLSTLCLVIIGLLFHSSILAENHPRTSILLDKGWGYKPLTSNKKDASLTPVTLPHTWNANYLEGTTTYNREMMVYKRDLEITPEMKDKRLFLYFEGVNSAADIFINYRTVGQHLGGYTAFCFEITDFVQNGNNDLEVWVSNAYRTDILPISGDFNIYGGIHRPCHLIITEKNCISPVFYASPGVFIHQNRITKQQAEICVESILSLKEVKSGLKLKTTITDTNGKEVTSNITAVSEETVKQPLTITNPILWNGKENPYLYNVSVELYDGDKVIDKVTQKTGFRYFHADPEKGFFLNGKYLNLYGFCRHEDVKGKGSALQQEDYDKDISLIKEVGATAMRLAHYPHAEPMYDLCDQNGIILWTEIPMCGPGGYAYTGYLHNKGFEDNARQSLKELVYQKFNHPSICFWGIFNELLITDNKKFQEYDNPVPFVREINELYKKLDPSCLTAFATCVDQTNYLGCSDLIAWNKYFGWKTSQQSAEKFFDDVKKNSNNQPVGVSEYGAGASIHQHACPLDHNTQRPKREHPEEYQAICHEGYWTAFTERPYLWAKFIWQFADAQSSIRQEGDTDGINDKGTITYDRKVKKDVFYFYKANWNSEPMLYICSRRFTERTNPNTLVKVYSNLNEATLYLNDKKIGKQKKDKVNRIIWDNITLSPGENVIRVEGKSGKEILNDTCIWTLK